MFWTLKFDITYYNSTLLIRCYNDIYDLLMVCLNIFDNAEFNQTLILYSNLHSTAYDDL
jgi:hypothetical protein